MPHSAEPRIRTPADPQSHLENLRRHPHPPNRVGRTRTDLAGILPKYWGPRSKIARYLRLNDIEICVGIVGIETRRLENLHWPGPKNQIGYSLSCPLGPENLRDRARRRQHEMQQTRKIIVRARNDGYSYTSLSKVDHRRSRTGRRNKQEF